MITQKGVVLMSSEFELEQCPSGGLHDFQPHEGRYKCMKCGLVGDPVFEPAVNLSQTHFFSGTERLGPIVPKFYKGFDKKLQRLATLQNQIDRNLYHRQDKLVNKYIDEIRNIIPFPDDLKKTVLYYFKKENKRRKITNIYHFTLILIFGFARLYGYGFSIKQMQKVATITGRSHGFKKKTFVKYIEEMNTQYNGIFKEKHDPEKLLMYLIIRVSQERTVKDRLRNQDFEKYKLLLFKHANNLRKYLAYKDLRGKNPFIKFLAYIYLTEKFLASLEDRRKFITQQSLSNATGFSTLTIRGHLNYLKNPLS